jgi:hypothetical protein
MQNKSRGGGRMITIEIYDVDKITCPRNPCGDWHWKFKLGSAWVRGPNQCYHDLRTPEGAEQSAKRWINKYLGRKDVRFVDVTDRMAVE